MANEYGEVEEGKHIRSDAQKRNAKRTWRVFDEGGVVVKPIPSNKRHVRMPSSLDEIVENLEFLL